MDNLERAGRILARAFGYGSSWHPDNNFDMERPWSRDGGEKTRRVQLGGMFEEEIPEADNTLSIRKAVRISSEKREAPVPGVSEFKKWSGEYLDWDNAKKRVRHVVGPRSNAVTPKVGPRDRTMIALAGIDKPLQAILMVYALTDGRYWPRVDQYARGQLAESDRAGIAEAMFRILKHATHRERAKILRMRETSYVEMIRPALCLFDSTLSRAGGEFMSRYGDAKRLIERMDHADRTLPAYVRHCPGRFAGVAVGRT